MASEEFWAEYQKARQATSIGGELCKFIGAAMPVLVLLFVPVALFNGSAGAGVVLVVTAMAFALAGAPVAALGTIATESKRQTRLKALELKYSEDAPEPPQSVVKDWSAQSSRGFWD